MSSPVAESRIADGFVLDYTGNYARAGSPLVLSAAPMVSGSVLRASCVEGNR
jgi:hypothetical protein